MLPGPTRAATALNFDLPDQLSTRRLPLIGALVGLLYSWNHTRSEACHGYL